MTRAAAMGAASRGGEHGGRPGERLRAELSGEAADLEGDDRAERDRHQDRRHQGDTRDEPGLLDELSSLEARGEGQLDDVERHAGDLPGSAKDRCWAQAHFSSCGPVTP